MVRVYDCLSHDFVYHDLSHMMTFIANHDHSRMGDTFNHDPKKMKMALSLIATIRGIPQLYNGDEMMFSCRPVDWSDGSKRIDFPGGWKEDKVNLFTEEGRKAAGKTAEADYSTAADLHDYTARLFTWRKDKKVLHDGKTMHFLARDNSYSFFRYNDKEAVYVFANNSAHTMNLPWDHYEEFVKGPVSGTNVMTGEKVTLDGNKTVPAGETLIVEFNR